MHAIYFPMNISLTVNSQLPFQNPCHRKSWPAIRRSMVNRFCNCLHTNASPMRMAIAIVCCCRMDNIYTVFVYFRCDWIIWCSKGNSLKMRSSKFCSIEHQWSTKLDMIMSKCYHIFYVLRCCVVHCFMLFDSTKLQRWSPYTCHFPVGSIEARQWNRFFDWTTRPCECRLHK